MNIAKMAIQISANADQATAGFKKAETVAGSFGAKMAAQQAALANQQEALAKKVAEREKKAAQDRNSLLKYAIGGTIGLATGAVAFGFSEGKGLVETAAKARMAGASVGEFRAAMIAAGPAAGAMETGLKNLSTAMGYLGAGVITPASKALNELGLTASGSALQDMEGFAAKLAAMESPALRMATAMQVLGDNASSLMPLLEKGGSAFEFTKGLSGSGGLGADQSEVTRIANAQQQLSSFWETLKNQGALALGPLLEELGKGFGGLAEGIKTGAKIIAYGGAVAVEAWKGLTIVWDGLKIGFKTLVSYILWGVAKAADGINVLTETFNDWTGASVGKIDTSWLKETSESWSQSAAKDSKQFWDYWANNKSAFKAVDELFVRMDTNSAKAAANLAKNPFFEALAKRFNESKEAMTSPLETYQRRLSEIAAFEENGLFAGDKTGLAARMRGKAFGELAAAINLQPIQAPGAAFKDSREAYSAVAAFERAGTRSSVQEQMKALMEEQRRQNDEQIRIGRELLEAARKQAENAGAVRGI